MDCNKTEVFLREKDRMCNFLEGCDKCKLTDGKYLWCNDFVFRCPKEAIKIVQKWSDEHQQKTRQSEFLKMFPNVKLAGGVIFMNPCSIDSSFEGTPLCEGSKTCTECRKAYWLAEVE